MTIRPKLILELCAVFVAVTSCPSFAQNQAGATPAITPDVATTVTTTGGTANKIAKFSGTSTIVNSIIYDNGTDVGIGTTSPTSTLTVDDALTLDDANRSSMDSRALTTICSSFQPVPFHLVKVLQFAALQAVFLGLRLLEHDCRATPLRVGGGSDRQQHRDAECNTEPFGGVR